MIIRPAAGPLRGTVRVPGDKSISHRSLMLGALARGTTRVRGLLHSADCRSTAACLSRLGVRIENDPSETLVFGRGLHGLAAPSGPLDCGNSATAMRLLTGLLAGQSFSSVLTGDASLRRRPMGRVIRPLSQMGARIAGVTGEAWMAGGAGEIGRTASAGQAGGGPLITAPLTVTGSRLHGADLTIPVASAQVWSALLLAALYADGPTRVTGPAPTRDHTERMLRAFGADLAADGLTVSVRPAQELEAQDIEVPGDLSSAAYWIAAGLLVPGSELFLPGVGVNPTRDGFLRAAARMGASVRRENERMAGSEPVADLTVTASELHGTVIEGNEIASLIDELPLLAVLAARADGVTVIRGASELRVKESDRLAATAAALRAMGARVEELPDGLRIPGPQSLAGGIVETLADHRIAMSFAVAALTASDETDLRGASCVDVSYPAFFDDLTSIRSDGC